MFEEFPVVIDGLRGSADAARLVDAAVDWGKVCAAAEAQRLAIIAEFAAVWLAGAGEEYSLCAVDEEDDVVAEIGAAFGVSPRWALGDLEVGAAMRERFPGLAALFLRGEVSAKVMATVVDRTVLVCDGDALALIDAACVDAAVLCGWSGLSYYKLKNAVDVWVDRYDPGAVRRVRDNVRNRGVQAGGTDEKSGTAAVFVRLTIPGAALLMGRLRKMAKGVCVNDPRTVDQRMADSLEALAADANRLKCLCGSPVCPAAADDGVASRYVVHVYAEAAALAAQPDPLIHGEGPRDDVRPDNVTVTPSGKAKASPEREDAEPGREAEGAGVAQSAEGAESGREADELKPSGLRQSPAPTAPAPSGESGGADGEPRLVEEPEPVAGHAVDGPAESADTAVDGVETADGNAAVENVSAVAPPTALGPPAGIIPGFGIVPNSLIAALIAAGADVRHIRAPALDPEDGYRSSLALREFVQSRDLMCRFPGCDRPIEFCDLDHTIAWGDGGPTHASDLKGYCRHHHLLKTFRDGWSETQLPDGTLILTTPTGRRYTTLPTSRLLFPNVDTTSAPVERGSRRKAAAGDRMQKMPQRKRSRAKDRAYRIAAERALNDAYVAERNKPPPF